MDDEDFLAAVEADNAGVTAEEPKVAEPEAAEPAPEPEAATPAEPIAEPANPFATPVVEAKPDPGFVPITSMLDEREKRQKLEAELARRDALQQQPAELPNMFEDPDGYTSALAQKFEQQLYQQSLQMSERFARNQYGNEATDAALQWATQKCDQDPYFNAQVKASGDPVGYAVQQYQRDQIVQSVSPEDLSQFQAWKQAQAALTAQPNPPPNPAAPETPSREIPPRSLASAPSAGGVMTEVVQSEEEVFDEMFARK